MAIYKTETIGGFDVYFDTYRHCYVLKDGTEFVTSADSFREIMEEIEEYEKEEKDG